MSPASLLVIAILAVNLAAYALMAFDKYRAARGGQRVAENTLFLLALMLGAPGVYLGMKAPLYHKASKTKFRIAIPALIGLNLVLAYFLFAR